MIEAICIGAGILFIIILLFLFFSKPFTYTKKIGKNKTSLSITAKCNLHKISVIARFGKEKIAFERKRIRKGRTIDFEYPSSKASTTVIVEEESGKKRTYVI